MQLYIKIVYLSIKKFYFFTIIFTFSIDKYTKIVYYIDVRQRSPRPLMKGSEVMTDLNVTQALLKAILELIEKCETLEELRESVKRIMNEQ